MALDLARGRLVEQTLSEESFRHAEEVEIELPPVIPRRRDGRETFHDDGSPLGASLSDFWSWSASDLLNNRMRGLVAEFLVATALDSAEAVRMEWDACDVVTSDGVRVEVKSAAYIQAWEQRTFSSIRFGVGERRTWDADAGNWTDESHRNADVYVFCLLDHRNQSTVDPLDVSQWRFYVVSTELLDTLGRQKSIGLASIVALGVEPVEFHDIATSVRAATNASG